MKKNLFIPLMVVFCLFSVPGCERFRENPVRTVVTPQIQVPTKDNPEAFTIAYVHAAIYFYQTRGREATISVYNDPLSIDGQWYVFIVDDNDLLVSQAALPERIGRDLKDSVGPDGYRVGRELAKATEAGHWVEYLWHNPEANKLQLKRTWVMRHDGYLFGSGYYQPWRPDPATLPSVSKADPEAFTVAVVLRAIAHYEFEGLQATVAYYNDPASIDGQWYVFIADANNITLAHPVDADLVGKDMKENLGLDGSLLGAEIAKATGGGLWIDYLWPNPATGKDELKRTWAIRHDGYLFASGYYVPTPVNAPN